jgi:transposase
MPLLGQALLEDRPPERLPVSEEGIRTPPKVDEYAQKLLEEDVKERPAATIAQKRRLLERLTEKPLSDSTVRRLSKRLGFSRKKRTLGASERDEWLRAAWRVMVAERIDTKRLVFVDEMGTNTSLSPLYAWSLRGQRARSSVRRNRGANTTLLASMSAEGMGPCIAVVGSTTAMVFEAYVEQALCPSLKRGQVVVMDNLSAHKGQRIRELIEGRGCELIYLPPYSPDFNPIEEAFSKIKGILRRIEARTREVLVGALGEAISAVTARDARGFFEHCGYSTLVQSL